MTAPKPPESDSFIQWGIHEAKAAELRCRQIHLTYHLAAVICALLLFFVGVDAWRWHIRKLARLEATASVERTKATNEHALGETWKARAIALTDSIKHDTAVVTRIRRTVKVDTILVPAAPVVQDGVTYSDGPPLVPMEVVARASFDSLGQACDRVAHDCASMQAAKDSAIAHLQAQLDATNARIAADAKARTSEKRAALFGKIAWGAVGIVLGHLAK